MENQKDRIERFKNAPFLPWGKYKGKRVTEVPMEYLRWILTRKDMREDLVAYAKEKVGELKEPIQISITGHAIDQFSLRWLTLWQCRNDLSIGLHRFIGELAQKALDEGEDVSFTRHDDEALRMKLDGIIFVYNRDAVIRTLITVM